MRGIARARQAVPLRGQKQIPRPAEAIGTRKARRPPRGLARDDNVKRQKSRQIRDSSASLWVSFLGLKLGTDFEDNKNNYTGMREWAQVLLDVKKSRPRWKRQELLINGEWLGKNNGRHPPLLRKDGAPCGLNILHDELSQW
jgi:hypothetical protein